MNCLGTEGRVICDEDEKRNVRQKRSPRFVIKKVLAELNGCV